MSWNYSGDPSSSDKDKVRFLIGDTDTNEQLLTDEEIDFLIGKHDSIWGTCAEACESIAAQYSKRSDVGLGGGMDSDISQKAQQYRDMAKEFRRKSAGAHVPFDGSGDPSLSRGMFDN